MLPVFFLLIVEVLTILILKERFFKVSPRKFWLSVTIHSIFSIGLWYLLIRILIYEGEFDTQENIWIRTAMMGMICGALFPRIVLIVFHYAGKLIRIRKKGYVRALTDTALWLCAIIVGIISLSTISGRFNYTIEKVEIPVRGLHPGLNGLTIVQISDLHLSTFYNNAGKLAEAVNIVNSSDPDIIMNTGDFVTYGSGEFGICDSILARHKSRYGNFAVLGNHDMGTYMPGSTPDWRAGNVERMEERISKSGYILLNNENAVVEINGAKLAIAGVTTAGRHPEIVHGDAGAAIAGIDSADFTILLAHDPNQWESDVAGKKDIDLTLSGHTHGMQMGIITRNFRWSPSKYFYPHWNGLYSENNQFHYVNRGLGLLAIPFRIWMPPEITIIKLIAG